MSTIRHLDPCESYSTPNWDNITVDLASLIHNKYGEIVYYNCYKCGMPASYVVSRTSTLTGNKYTDYMCRNHAAGWLPNETQSNKAGNIGNTTSGGKMRNMRRV